MMTDEKAEHIEATASAVVDALGISDASIDPDSSAAWADLDPLVQNKVRVALAEAYDAWEKHLAANTAADRPKRLGLQKALRGDPVL